MSPWVDLYCPGYAYVVLDTIKKPWINLCRPGYTYGSLDTLMSPWIHLCRPGYTYVALDTHGDLCNGGKVNGCGGGGGTGKWGPGMRGGSIE
jgi:hypothetical protein